MLLEILIGCHGSMILISALLLPGLYPCLMARASVQLAVDSLALVACTFVATTGLVLQTALPPGSGRLEAGLPERQIVLLWGLSRHEWGRIHLWAAYALLAILVLHLALHWKWLVAMLTRKREKKFSGTRFALGCLGLVGLLLAFTPLLGAPHSVARSQALQERGLSSESLACERRVSLEELEQVTGVSAATLRERLGAEVIVVARADDSGKQIYERHCGSCHGSGGVGPLPADPAQAASLLGKTRPQAPHQAALKAMREDELRSLLEYLRGLKNSTPGTP